MAGFNPKALKYSQEHLDSQVQAIYDTLPHIIDVTLYAKFSRHVVIVLCFLIAYLTRGKTQYFGYGNVLLGLVYYHIGHELKLYENFFQKRKRVICVCCMVTYLTIGLFLPTSLSFVFNLLTKGNYFLNLLFSISACGLLYYFFNWFSSKYENNKLLNVLSYYGRISIVVFAFHRPVLNWILEPLLRNMIPDISYLSFLLICLITLLVSASGFYYFVNKFAPRLIGKV